MPLLGFLRCLTAQTEPVGDGRAHCPSLPASGQQLAMTATQMRVVSRSGAARGDYGRHRLAA
jgi:hypothetical protein